VVVLTPRGEPALASLAFAKGASEVLALPVEPETLRLSLDVAVRQARLRSRLHAAYRRGGNLETNDPVTGLFTVEFLHRHLELLIEDAFRWDRSLSVVTCLIPQLAAIAHDHGREAAAAVMRAAATVVSRLVRGEDLCACLGDHGFCAGLPESSLEATSAIMQRLRGVLRHTEFGLNDGSRPITLHVELGSAEFKPGDTPETLVARAQDAALSVAA
jgi:two-component system cell cycle response regulator